MTSKLGSWKRPTSGDYWEPDVEGGAFVCDGYRYVIGKNGQTLCSGAVEVEKTEPQKAPETLTTPHQPEKKGVTTLKVQLTTQTINNIQGVTEKSGVCEGCGEVFFYHSNQHKRFCNSSCRVLAHRKKTNAAF